jgi:hypothetical protein
MNHYGTLRDYEFQNKNVDDIRGSERTTKSWERSTT